jgi:hypothetical protein
MLFLVTLNFFFSSAIYIWVLVEGGAVISVVLNFPVAREIERDVVTKDYIQSHKTEEETGTSIVGLCVVFSFSNSLG